MSIESTKSTRENKGSFSNNRHYSDILDIDPNDFVSNEGDTLETLKSKNEKLKRIIIKANNIIVILQKKLKETNDGFMKEKKSIMDQLDFISTNYKTYAQSHNELLKLKETFKENLLNQHLMKTEFEKQKKIVDNIQLFYTKIFEGITEIAMEHNKNCEKKGNNLLLDIKNLQVRCQREFNQLLQKDKSVTFNINSNFNTANGISSARKSSNSNRQNSAEQKEKIEKSIKVKDKVKTKINDKIKETNKDSNSINYGTERINYNNLFKNKKPEVRSYEYNNNPYYTIRKK
ncbi:MAG: hypothetical protein MJ252_12535 [archaeon]|nr:hypothetical protein [archaeon]